MKIEMLNFSRYVSLYSYVGSSGLCKHTVVEFQLTCKLSDRWNVLQGMWRYSNEN